mgnify:CR=1 FL=1
MDVKEFVERNTRIAAALDAVAKRMENMAWVGTAHTDNPDFVDLLNAQDFLIERAEKLLDVAQREGLT